MKFYIDKNDAEVYWAMFRFSKFAKLHESENYFVFPDRIWNIYLCDEKNWHFFDVEFFRRTEKQSEYIKIAKLQEARIILDLNSCPAKFLGKMEKVLKKEESLDMMELIVPECFTNKTRGDHEN